MEHKQLDISDLETLQPLSTDDLSSVEGGLLIHPGPELLPFDPIPYPAPRPWPFPKPWSGPMPTPQPEPEPHPLPQPEPRPFPLPVHPIPFPCSNGFPMKEGHLPWCAVIL